MKKYNVFMGWDSREPLAYDVARHSILQRTEANVVVRPLELNKLGDILTRPVETKDGKLWCPISQAHMSTEFANSRFCVPFLQRDGWALFVDSDILCTADITELFALRDEKYAVMVVKHNHTSGADTKMDGQVQSYYNRKNWSSVVLWNCGHPANERLTLQDLNSWPGRDLHAFKWLQDSEIGELPPEWNHLVNVNPPMKAVPKILHYTEGGPWLQGWTMKDHIDWLWMFENASMKGIDLIQKEPQSAC